MTVNKKWVFIVNPAAGNGYAGKIFPKVKKKIRTFGIRSEIVFSRKKKHATDIAKAFVDRGFSHVIAVGGDGTVNEVASGVVGSDSVFGVLPAGTGNDFVHVLGFSENFSDDDWCAFSRAQTIRMDVGTCNGNYFFNGMGIGFDAEVASGYEREYEERGASNYLKHIVKTLLTYKEKPVRVVRNNVEKAASCFIKTIGIGRRFGGGYQLTAKAIANDGLFDICSVEKLSVMQRLRLFPGVRKGKHIENKKVSYYRADELLIESGATVPCHLDGEVFYDNRFAVKLLHRKMRVIYKPAGIHYFKEQ